MQAGTVMDSLTKAFVKALEYDLIPHTYPETQYKNMEEGQVPTGQMIEKRPHEEHCHIFHFPQQWGSTSTAFGGIGGAAITTSYTTVVIGPYGDACVYFGGRLGYHIQRPNATFAADLGDHKMKPVSHSHVYEHSFEGN